MAKLEAEVQELSRALPASLGETAFVDAVETRARSLGVTLQAEPGRVQSGGLVDEAEIDVRLEGPPEAVAQLGAEVERGERLAVWRPGADGRPTTVSIYALPAPVEPAAGGDCAPEDDGPWLWPFEGPVDELRSMIAAPDWSRSP